MIRANRQGIRPTAEDRVINVVVFVILLLSLLVTYYPFHYCLVLSFNNGMDASAGGIFFWPRQFTLDNYKVVLTNSRLISGFVVSVMRTVIGTFASVAVNMLLGYVLVHENLLFRKFYMRVLIFSMYFGGGLIPTFILFKSLGLYNSFAVYVVPGLVGMFNILIIMSYLRTIPRELTESAQIDGAGFFKTFFRIIIPVSAPIIATIALFVAVGHWNSWMDSAYYVNKQELRTMSYWLMDIINQANLANFSASRAASSGGDITRAITGAAQTFTAETIRMTTIIVVIIPIVLVYPFLQKYFVKGIMLGSVKG